MMRSAMRRQGTTFRTIRSAMANGATTVAFPGISTGVYGYPLEDATRLAMTTVKDCLAEMPEIEEVVFVTFGDEATATAHRVLAELSRD
jgi:O-acetyl-ADP-ribose deacetylase (regulator of RNase III)